MGEDASLSALPSYSPPCPLRPAAFPGLRFACPAWCIAGYTFRIYNNTYSYFVVNYDVKEKERRAEEEPNRHHENDVRIRRKNRPGKEKGKAWTKGPEKGRRKEGRGVCRRAERVAARLMFRLKTMRAQHDDPSAEGEKGADQAGDAPPWRSSGNCCDSSEESQHLKPIYRIKWKMQGENGQMGECFCHSTPLVYSFGPLFGRGIPTSSSSRTHVLHSPLNSVPITQERT